MRRLMLLRHAKAEKGSAGGRDFDRGLAQRGRDESPRMGDYMAHHELNPDLVVASPARRVRETWELVAPAFRPAPPVVWEERLYEVEGKTVLKLLKAVATDAHTLLVVGHNPGLQDFAKLVIASGDVEARERLNENLPTAGLLVIDFAFDKWDKLHARSGRLDRFVSPRLLTAATD